MNAINPAQLTSNLSGHWHGSYGVAPCPVCQIERRKDQNALTINVDGERLLLHCKKLGCEFRDILAAAGITAGTFEVDALAMENARREREAKAAKVLTRARSLFDYAKPIIGTKGEVYLRERGISCSMPRSLRWASDIYHAPSGSYCSAMIAQVSPTGAVHRTFFTKQGIRLDKVPSAAKNCSPKMMLGSCQGGAVALSGDDGPLVVTEGIETGLSLLSGLLSGPHTVWAALSRTGMAGLELPRDPHDLIIATDGDEPGATAGNQLAQRAQALWWNVSLLPAPDGQDWNDVLQSEVTA
jgi:phage/plasmid primase-like uncharacterized protein